MSNNLKRNIKRKKELKIRKQTEKDLANKITEQMSMFNMLPNQCNRCSAKFNKKNKKYAMTWKVVVKNESVNLFCPDCVDKLVETHESV
jgi:hypothetical protein